MAHVDRLDEAPILHEEVDRLPAKYREPLVLCYFQGLTHDEAASQLGWPVGTVRSRLAEARVRLRPRLLRRGVAPSVAILAASGQAEAAAVVPASLVSATVRMAVEGGRGRDGPGFRRRAGGDNTEGDDHLENVDDRGRPAGRVARRHGWRGSRRGRDAGRGGGDCRPSGAG